MVRGTGKFKQKRGGGRSFSKHMVLDENGTAVADDKWRRRDKGEEEEEDDSDDSDDDDEEEEEEEGEEGEEGEADKPELTRTERRELKKKQAAEKQKKAGGGDNNEEDEDAGLINPNHVKKKMNVSDLSAPRELSRKEREEKEKQDAKDRYWKLHVQGKTEEAKSDLARLAKIRAEREAAQAKRKAEAEAKAAEVDVKNVQQKSRKKN